MKPIIEVENLGKRYRLGRVGAGSLRDELENGWRRLRGELPKTDARDFWALKDVSFSVNEGEVLGVIGRNGAGKSTLLKLLSRITEPTTGRAVLRGRVASLLEVGTGFHPELSGRENIFLNGAVLGMTRGEVLQKFDEIVDFSGVEQFLDTPVKRYSSGMRVRLGFAVAAHLEPEILIIDEVLAVGDAEFQKKCLGKMGEVARAGRTVLFVSHNMPSIQSLCTRCMLLESGTITSSGSTKEAIDRYLENTTTPPHPAFNGGYGEFVESCRIESGKVRLGESMVIAIALHKDLPREGHLVLGVYDEENVPVLHFSSELCVPAGDFRKARAIRLLVPKIAIQVGRYYLNIAVQQKGTLVEHLTNIAPFEVMEGDFFGGGRMPPRTAARFFQDFEWRYK